ncbi:MAG: flagellar brake domain-containing protein [bacterium]
MASAWDNVHIKQRIEITIRTPKQVYSFGSIIVRKNDGEVYFRMPASRQSAEAIRKGKPVEVVIHAEGGVLKFKSEIGAIQSGEPPSAQIPRPPDDAIQSEGKDGFYELKVEIPIQYRIMRDPVTPISEYKKGATDTLSADECVIITEKSLAPGGFIELTLNIPGEEEVSFVGKTGACEPVPGSDPPSFMSRIGYEVIKRGEQDRIMKFVFAKQRSLRKRGMH